MQKVQKDRICICLSILELVLRLSSLCVYDTKSKQNGHFHETNNEINKTISICTPEAVIWYKGATPGGLYNHIHANLLTVKLSLCRRYLSNNRSNRAIHLCSVKVNQLKIAHNIFVVLTLFYVTILFSMKFWYRTLWFQFPKYKIFYIWVA